jgi:hypothetical protein
MIPFCLLKKLKYIPFLPSLTLCTDADCWFLVCSPSHHYCQFHEFTYHVHQFPIITLHFSLPLSPSPLPFPSHIFSSFSSVLTSPYLTSPPYLTFPFTSSLTFLPHLPISSFPLTSPITLLSHLPPITFLNPAPLNFFFHLPFSPSFPISSFPLTSPYFYFTFSPSSHHLAQPPHTFPCQSPLSRSPLISQLLPSSLTFPSHFPTFTFSSRFSNPNFPSYLLLLPSQSLPPLSFCPLYSFLKLSPTFHYLLFPPLTLSSLFIFAHYISFFLSSYFLLAPDLPLPSPCAPPIPNLSCYIGTHLFFFPLPFQSLHVLTF